MAEIIFGRSRIHKLKTAADNADYLRVIGAGLARTGTSSLKAALELLGFGPCHHMSEVFDKPDRATQFIRAYNGENVDFFQFGDRRRIALPQHRPHHEAHHWQHGPWSLRT